MYNPKILIEGLLLILMLSHFMLNKPYFIIFGLRIIKFMYIQSSQKYRTNSKQ